VKLNLTWNWRQGWWQTSIGPGGTGVAYKWISGRWGGCWTSYTIYGWGVFGPFKVKRP
jgi:hypothetical protein